MTRFIRTMLLLAAALAAFPVFGGRIEKTSVRSGDIDVPVFVAASEVPDAEAPAVGSGRPEGAGGNARPGAVLEVCAVPAAPAVHLALAEPAVPVVHDRRPLHLAPRLHRRPRRPRGQGAARGRYAPAHDRRAAGPRGPVL